jgi:hypothetical protein
LIPRVACLSLLAVCTLAQPTPQEPPRPAPDAPQVPSHDGRGALAVLRRDGVMFPFASFNKDSWRVSWPGILSRVEIPVTLPAVPNRWWGTETPDEWRAHLLSGETLPIEPLTPVTFSTMCSRRLGIRTSYRSALSLPPVPVEPFPKDGIAVSGNVPLEPIERMDPSSAEWTALSVALLNDFNRAEDQTVRGVAMNASWRHPIPAAERRKMPIRLESWYRSPSGEPGWTVSYIEAVRAYPPGPEDNGCGLETLVSGWLHHQDGVMKRRTNLRGKVTYCDRVGATYMLPFGRIRPRDRTYWVFQMSGWEVEWYDVAEVGPEKVRHVVEVYAGGLGCR